MSRFDNEPIFRTTTHAAVDEGLKAFMVRVFGYMGLGIGLTAAVAFILMGTPELMATIANSGLVYVAMFAPLAIVMFLSFRLHRMDGSTAQLTFWIYSAVMGVSMAFMLIGFQPESVFRIFLISASLFGSMSLYGYTTQKDLTSMGSFMIMGLWGLILASLVNIFMKSSAMDFMLSLLAVVVFTGLTAYDTQAIKEMYYDLDDGDVMTKKAIFGALRLYLDFVNIFISLLRLFGDRR